MLTYFNNYIKTRLPAITCKECILGPIYRNIGNTFLVDIIMLLNFHMAYVQYAITALVSLNRMTVMIKYTVIEPIWKKYMWIPVFLIFTVPLLNSRVVFNYVTVVTYSDSTEAYSVTSPMPINDIFSLCIPFMIGATILSVVFNVISITMVRHVNMNKKNRAEFNFIIMTSITCAVQVCGTALSVSRLMLVGTDVAVTLAGFIPFISDGLSLVQPWLLFGFSHIIRGKINESFGIKKRRGAISISVVRSFTN
uniref:Serpentine receptor class gamma n=1 Tax=Caenorhabditis tropicalis TaxID=1561998 RepID=A0A1I7T652_9PELO